MRPGDRVRVSTSGGSQPRWRADGKELFYLALDGAMMSVDTSDPVNPAAPRKLFESRFWVNPVEDQYDVTADGQRFLLDRAGRPAGHAVDGPHQLAVRLERDDSRFSQDILPALARRGIQNPPTAPAHPVPLGRRATSCVRPSGLLSCVRRPASRRAWPPNRLASVRRPPSGPGSAKPRRGEAAGDRARLTAAAPPGPRRSSLTSSRMPRRSRMRPGLPPVR